MVPGTGHAGPWLASSGATQIDTGINPITYPYPLRPPWTNYVSPDDPGFSTYGPFWADPFKLFGL